MAGKRGTKASKGESGPKASVKDFAETVALLKGFAASERTPGSDPAYRNLYFEDGTVWARSGALAAVKTFSCGIDVPFAVPAERLAAALASCTAQGVAEIDLSLDKSALVWRGGAAKGRIALSVDTKPPRPDVPAVGVEVDPSVGVGIARALFAVPKGDQYPMLRGVYWSSDGSVMASDGDRLVLLRVDTACPRDGGVLIPEHLLRAAKGVQITATHVDDRQVWLGTSDGTMLAGVLLHAEFPRARVVDALGKLSESAKAGEMTRVDLTDGQPVRALLSSVVEGTVPPLHAVDVNVHADGIEVSCGREDGEVRVEIAAKVAGVPRHCRINGQYLLTAMDQGVPLYFGSRCLYTADDERKFSHAVMFFAE